MYITHPYDEKRKRTVLDYDLIKKYRNSISCIECYNGRNISLNYGIKQNEISDTLKIKKVIGSDAHTFFEIGRNYMCIDDKYDISIKEEFLKSINDAIYIKKPCLKISHTITNYIKIFKLLLRGEFYEVFRVINKRIRKRV